MAEVGSQSPLLVTTPLMPRLRHLGIGQLSLGRRPVADLFPNLSSLSLGLCLRLEAARWPAVDGNGANADATTRGPVERFGDTADAAALVNQPQQPIPQQPLAAIQNALAADPPPLPGAAIAGAAVVGAAPAAPRGEPIEIKDLMGLENLERLDLSGFAASHIIRSWRRGASGVSDESATGGSPLPLSLRQLHLWDVASHDDLVLAAELIAAACACGEGGAGRLDTLGLHGCGPPHGTKPRPGSMGPEDVIRNLEGFVTNLVLQVWDTTHDRFTN